MGSKMFVFGTHTKIKRLADVKSALGGGAQSRNPRLLTAPISWSYLSANRE